MPCVGAATTPACSVPECARERHRRACANAPPSWRVFPPESETRSPDCNSCCSACVCLPPAGSAPWACSTELPSAKTCWCSCRNSVRKSVGAAIAAACSGEGGAGGVCAQRVRVRVRVGRGGQSRALIHGDKTRSTTPQTRIVCVGMQPPRHRAPGAVPAVRGTHRRARIVVLVLSARGLLAAAVCRNTMAMVLLVPA